MTQPPWLGEDVVVAARHLLGWQLISEIGGEAVTASINEVEAYAGETDPASHAFRGPTPRNTAMFGPPGGLYVYRSYGIHWCMNVVVGQPGLARAVLLRGATIESGTAVAERRRGRADHLADGPGKLTQALGVTGEYDGHMLDSPPLRLLPPAQPVTAHRATPRIGISRAKGRRWRFVATKWAEATG